MANKDYCYLCDGYGGTHAPCTLCGEYCKTGMVLGGISPGTKGGPPLLPSSPPQKLDDRLSVNHYQFRTMPSKPDWLLIERMTRNAICENASYATACGRNFTKITYNGSNVSPVAVYLCQDCGSRFLEEGIEKVLDDEEDSI